MFRIRFSHCLIKRLTRDCRYFYTKELLFKISVQKTFERSAVTSLVSCHFVNGIMDRIEILRFRQFCKFRLTCRGAVFRRNAHRYA